MKDIVDRLDKIILLLEALNGRKEVGQLDATAITPLSRPKTRGRMSGDEAKKCRAFLGLYCDAFKARYGTNPIIDGKSAGLVSNVLKVIPLERAQDLVQAYLQMDSPWFKTRCHDLVCFSQNLSLIAVALASGSQNPADKIFWENIFQCKTTDMVKT